MRKRVMFFVAAAMMTVLAAGCQKKEPDITPTKPPENQAVTPDAVPTPTQEPTQAPTPTPAPTNTPVPTVWVTPTLVPKMEVVKHPFDFGEMRGLSPKEIVADMKVGWNLGNTLDAIDGTGLGSETSWGNPKTTQEMIDMVAAYGFDVLRVPVTWGNHLIDDDYTIDPEWMARVKETVEYGLEDGMYVILNMHHEEMWRKPDYANLEATRKENAALWKQIALYFQEYGDHLIFEGMNEPRVKGSENEWDGGTEEGRDCINQLNADFVATVRAAGGNNATRLLLITTYASASTTKAYKDFIFPDDENIALSLHAYTPYRFTYDSKGESWNTADFGAGVQSEINGVMDDMVRFAQKGDVPVIITECGSVVKKNKAGDLNFEAVGKWAVGYMEAAKKRHMPCVLWDNNAFNSTGENFGLLNRKNLEWYYPDTVNAVTEVFYSTEE